MYVTYQEMIDMGLILATTPEAKVEIKIEIAQRLVESYTGRWFESKHFEFTKTPCQNFCFFDTPALQIEVFDDCDGELTIIPPNNYELVDQRSPSYELFGIRFHTTVSDIVRFRGNFGMLEGGLTPKPIKYVTGKLASYLLDPVLYANINTRLISSESADNHSISYNKDAIIFTGDVELDDIIRLYRKQSGDVHVALI